MRIRFSWLLALTAIGILLVALMQPTLALADDATPPAPDAEATEPTPTEAPATATPIPVEPTAEEAAAPDLELPEILEQAPEGTEVVVLDENGEPQALATEETLEVLLQGDPVWCPSTVLAPTPGSNGCTAGATSFATLLTQLGGGGYTGAGTIWVAFNYDGTNDTTAINFDGTAAGVSNLTDLIVQGGWNGVSGSNTITTPSTVDDKFSIYDWQGNITLNDLIFAANASGAALNVQTDGDIQLDNVVASGNASGSGADLDTCDYDGATGLCAGTGSITVDNSTFDTNAFNGLVTDSGGDTSLDNVQANGNGQNGAFITGADNDGTGNVSVQNSTFSNNINAAGLDVYSDGNISLNNVVADGNFTGMLLDTTAGTGTIAVTNTSQASSNTGTGLHAISYGDITVSQFTADTNGANGAYLVAGLSGNVTVNNTSSFTGNANYGLFAKSAAGNISVTNVTANGNSEAGAFLKTFSGGNVTVDTGTFNSNTLSGLVIASSGQVDLNNVTANANGSYGAEVYSTYTYFCSGPNNITVNVDGGTYSNNLFYGLYVAPGAAGTLVFVNPVTYAPANGSGDYQLVLQDPECPNDIKPVSKPLKIVDVPFKAGLPVGQECDLYSGSMLVLPNGTSVKITCPYTGETQLEGLEEGDLPGLLGAGGTFVQGISVKFNSEGQPVLVLTEGGLLTLSFDIPADSRGRRHSILFWDSTANNGVGAWIQLPPFEFGTSFKLNPDDPDDKRVILTGVRQEGNTMVATVNFPGIFILVSE